MATRQYIGARYVPKYDGTHDINKSYEPLTIVTDINLTTSYTSKKMVPVGTPLTDTNYWAISGTLSGAVLDLQTRMGNAETNLEILNNESPTGTIIFAGDSYGSDATGGWISKLVNIMGLTSADYYDAHQDGASFGAGSYLTRLTQVVSTMTTTEKNNVKKLLVLGGINDSASPTETILDPAFSNYADFVKNNLPNCKVYIGFIGNFIANSAILHGRDGVIDCIRIYEELSGKYNFEFISNMEYILHDYSLMAADGIHPTSAGAEKIARYANTALKSGSVDIKYREYYGRDDVASIFDFSGISSGWGCNILAPAFGTNYDFANFIDNGVLNMQARVRFNLSPTAPTRVAQGAQIVLGRMNTKLFSGRPFTIIPVDCEAKLSDNSFIPLKGHFIFNSGNMYFRVDQIGDNWGVQTNEVTQILINPFTITLPTMYC